MKLFAVSVLLKGEEVLVNYNYDLSGAPPWYLELWEEFCVITNNGQTKPMAL
jgi:hypothetical protein